MSTVSLTKRHAVTGILIALTALILSGCARLPGSGKDDGSESGNAGNYNPNAGRYSQEHDSPELESFDPASIRPVVPRREERTRAGNTSPYTVNGRTYDVLDSEEDYTATGHASWYGRKFHGHATANGETYDMFQLTAAHRTLPIPSYARVTNLDNGREVIVRVNDRGPFHDDRIIDLSFAAASMLDYAENGTARVRVEAVLPDADPVERSRQVASAPAGSQRAAGETSLSATEGEDYLQVGAFSSYAGAEELLQRLSVVTTLPAFIRSEPGDGSRQLHRVRIGPLTPGRDMERLVDSLVEAGLGTPFRVRQ